MFGSLATDEDIFFLSVQVQKMNGSIFLQYKPLDDFFCCFTAVAYTFPGPNLAIIPDEVFILTSLRRARVETPSAASCCASNLMRPVDDF